MSLYWQINICSLMAGICKQLFNGMIHQHGSRWTQYWLHASITTHYKLCIRRLVNLNQVQVVINITLVTMLPFCPRSFTRGLDHQKMFMLKSILLTFVYKIVEHTEIDEHLEEIVENLIIEHLFYAISIATNNTTPGIFSTALIVKRVWLLGTLE